MVVDPGECVSISGASGSGKTVFLRALADIDRSSGVVRLNGTERNTLSGPQWRGRVRYLAAEPGFWAERVSGHFVDADRTMILLNALGMPDEAPNWQVERLSTGERQRAGLAIALADNPPVILADEPTSALDDDNAGLVGDLFQRMLGDGAAIVLVSHDKNFSDQLADRHFVIENGAISQVPS